TTAALTEAVARAGGFPFVAGGYLSAAAMAAQVDRMRETTDIFGVNLFAPNPVPIDRVAFDSFVAALTPAAAERGLSVDPEPVHAVGTQVVATVTTAAEARAAAERGVDGLIVQGPRAGGHSGTADPTRTIEDRATTDLVRDILAEVDLPVAAGGGVDGPDAV